MSEKRKRLSGAQYRKLKVQKVEAVKRNTSDITKFFQKNEDIPQQPSTSNQRTSSASDESLDADIEVKIPKENPSTKIEVMVSTDADTDNTHINFFDIFNHSDPSVWPTPLSDKIRLMLVEKSILPNKKNLSYRL